MTVTEHHDVTTELAMVDLDREEQRARALEVLEDFLPERTKGGQALVAYRVSISFGGVKAVQDVSLVVPAHTFVGLLGPNGAGKSTLFDLLNGLKRPDSGQVTLFGEDVTNQAPWDRAKLGMGRTFQSNKINLNLTVGENLVSAAHQLIEGGLFSTLLGLPKAFASEQRARDAALAMACLLDIDQHFDDRAEELDFGRQRRVEIGRSLMSGPSVLLLDEPAAGLDAHEVASLFELLRKLQQDLGLTVVLVEHYVKAVLDNADIVYVLNQGRLIASGTPGQVVADPVVQEEYLGNVLGTEADEATQAGTTSIDTTVGGRHRETGAGNGSVGGAPNEIAYDDGHTTEPTDYLTQRETGAVTPGEHDRSEER